MTAQLLLFWVFSAVLILSAVMLISARNPVHSVLFLILAFFNAAGLFVLAGAELLAMTLVIVYVGAVAVLFLFVVMMFDVHLGRLTQVMKRYKLLSSALGIILFAEMVMLYIHWQTFPLASDILSNPVRSAGLTNAHALGSILYTNYAYLFQVSGLLLLVAIIGAITLTLREREGTRRQNIDHQVRRDPVESITMVDVKSGEGVSL